MARQSSSSHLQFSKEKIECPISMYPELATLPTEILLWIFEKLCTSEPQFRKDVKRLKENYLRDKSSCFQWKPESYYRDLLRRDGKIDLDFWIGRDWDEDEDYEDDDDDDDDEFDDYDDDEFDDYEEYEKKDDYDEDEYEVIKKEWKVVLMGKQFLLKYIELGRIEVDLEQASVQKAQWALYNNGGEKDMSIMFLNDSIFMDSAAFLKTTEKVPESHLQVTQVVWKTS